MGRHTEVLQRHIPKTHREGFHPVPVMTEAAWNIPTHPQGCFRRKHPPEKRTGAASGQPSVTSYLYDLTDTYGQVLAEDTDGAGTLYLYGLERTAALTTADGITERTGYQYDARGSVVRTITGSSIASHRYTPYGEQILTDGERKASGYLYNGEAYDAMTGSYYLRARHYEPAMMRFSQPDIVRGSITEPLSLNCYLYVQDNPVGYEDPSGEFIVPAILIGAGVAFGLAVNAGINAASGNAVQTTQNTQKTTSRIINAIKASAGLKTIVDALNKSVAGKVVVQLGTAFVNVVTETQAKAVVKAQEAYDAIRDSDPESVRKWQKAYQEACSTYINNTSEQGLSYEDYWNRDDGYFDDEHWTHDQDKLDEAFKMLMNEYASKGEINLLDLAVAEEGRKIQFIRELVYADSGDTTIFSEGTNNQIENILTNYSTTVEEGGERTARYQETKSLTLEDVVILKSFHDNNEFKDVNHAVDEWLDAGWDDVLAGAGVLAGGAIVVHGYGKGKTANTSSKAKKNYTIDEGNRSKSNPLENIVYTDKVKKQMSLGDYHAFPKSVDGFGDIGKMSTITGGDGKIRTLIEISGSYKGKNGVFQYIVEADGVTCNHRLFVPE